MPRKYSLKFGGTTDPDAPIPPVVLIGILLCCVVFCGIASGLIGYFGFVRETCKDKDDDDNFIHEDLCPSGKELKEGTCEGECDESTCCKEYNCNPPTSLPRGYKRKSGQSLSTTIFKSVSDFESNPSLSSKVECDTNYTGAPVATSCAGNSNKKWSLSGCSTDLPDCVSGSSGSPYQDETRPRSQRECGNILSTGLFSGIDDAVSLDSTKSKECDKHFSSSGRFCILNRTGLDSCMEGPVNTHKCALP